MPEKPASEHGELLHSSNLMWNFHDGHQTIKWWIVSRYSDISSY